MINSHINYVIRLLRTTTTLYLDLVKTYVHTLSGINPGQFHYP